MLNITLIERRFFHKAGCYKFFFGKQYAISYNDSILNLQCSNEEIDKHETVFLKLSGHWGGF